MKIIVCVDQNNGILFNQRRVSSDKSIFNDIKKNNYKIGISEYSKDIFDDNEVDYQVIDNGNFYDYIFVEDYNYQKLDNIDEIIVYNFNRKYPSDYKLKLNFDDYQIVNNYDFVGNSHDKITKVIYQKNK